MLDLENIPNLNDVIVKHPTATFYGRVNGNSMKDAGAEDGDLLVIDKSLEYRDGAMVVCCVNGEFTLKRIMKSGNRVFLMPANSEYEPIEVHEGDEFTVWGIVTYIVKKA